MSEILTLTGRELRERWAVAVAAGVAALIPVVAPLLPGTSGAAGDVREVTGWLVALTMGAGFGLLLGASVIARDVAEGRIGFYFALPVSGTAIWAAKMAGAALLALMAALLPVATAYLAGFVPGAGGRGVMGGWPEGLAVVVGLAVTSVLVGHAAAVMVRSRSRWQLVDVTGLVLVVAGAWWALATLYRAVAGDAMVAAVVVLMVAVPVTLLLAGAAQTVGGRTDIVRGHRLLSLTLWVTLAAVTVLLIVGAYWVVTPDPGDLDRTSVLEAAPNGSWLIVSGTARGRGDMLASFLLDADNGRFLRLPARRAGGETGGFSADGRRAVWSVPVEGPGSHRYELLLADLGAGEARLEPTTITLGAGWSSAVALDATGERVAVVSEDGVAVSTLPGGKIMAAARLPAELNAPAALFVAPDRVRIYGWRGDGSVGALWIGELDVAARRLEPTGTIAGVSRYHWGVRLGAEAERMVVMRNTRSRELRALVCEGRTGATLADLTARGWLPVGGAELLADGGAAVVERNGDENRVRVVAEDGSERTVPLPPSARAVLGPEAARGTLLVGVAGSEAGGDEWTTLAVTPATGSIREIGQGRPNFVWWWPRVQAMVAPGSVAARLVDGGTSLELLDPELTTATVVAGSR